MMVRVFLIILSLQISCCTSPTVKPNILPASDAQQHVSPQVKSPAKEKKKEVAKKGATTQLPSAAVQEPEIKNSSDEAPVVKPEVLSIPEAKTASVQAEIAPAVSEGLPGIASPTLAAGKNLVSEKEPTVPAPVFTLVPTPTPTPTSIGITGVMTIDFASRTNLEKFDSYSLDLLCANSLRISGKILRKPRFISKILGREERPLQIEYDLNLAVINPENRKESKPAGSWAGTLNVSTEGIYTPSNLKISSILEQSASPLSGAFTGQMRGQAEKGVGLFGKLREYSRNLGGKKISLSVKKVDPLEFVNLGIAGGPIELYPAAKASGNFDYDYDTGNWLTNGITLRYSSGDPDKIGGSVKWVEDPRRATNGRGEYKVNLRFNEDRFTPSQSEESFFESVSDEEAFFMVDDSIPTLSGTIRYQDKLGPVQEDGEPQVLRSSIQYDLKSSHLSKQQLVTFLKLWLLIVGPVNDE